MFPPRKLTQRESNFYDSWLLIESGYFPLWSAARSPTPTSSNWIDEKEKLLFGCNLRYFRSAILAFAPYLNLCSAHKIGVCYIYDLREGEQEWEEDSLAPAPRR